MGNSKRSPSQRKSSKPQKPRPDFPLFPHAAGYWAKKVRGKLHYFGKIADDPKGENALNRWLDQKDDLLAGRTPRTDRDGLTVGELCNRFLTAKQHLLGCNEIVPRTFQTYKAATDRIVAVFGKNRFVDDLVADDFGAIREEISKTRGPTALGNEIQCVRMVFKFAWDEGLVERPVRYGQQFNKPSKKTLRKNRAKSGKRMFEAEEIRKILEAADGQLLTLILLGINCGFGQSDLAALPHSAINLGKGWVDYPRPKTGVHRRCPLWPETVEAIRKTIEDRPTPKDDSDAELVFVTKYGQRWVKSGNGSSDDAVAKEFSKLLKGLNLYRRGRGFYALRHTFQTIGEEAGETATRFVMGHVDYSMSAVYREHIADERLTAVAEHVRQWLFGEGRAK